MAQHRMGHSIWRLPAISLRLLITSRYRFQILLVLAIILLEFPNTASGQSEEVPLDTLSNCSTRSDEYFGNAQSRFDMIEWYRRGLCIRHGGNDPKCYTALNNVLKAQLNEIRKGEYAGAAGVMALLPTIGALLGAPTNEIWRLLTMVPFGGALAMALSFGGAILPVKAKDYESAFMKRQIIDGRPKGPRRTNSNMSFFKDPPSDHQLAIIDRASRLMEKVDSRLRSKIRKSIPVNYIWSGLVGMLLLLFGAHASMVIVEQGSILPWWCASRWWIHMWYGMVITTAVVDNWVQLPFSKQWSLRLSDIPYPVSVEYGDDITTCISPSKSLAQGGEVVDNVGKAITQLSTLAAGKLVIDKAQQQAKSVNTLYVIVSIAEQRVPFRKAVLRSCSKLASIGVFITGTAMFASAQLLPIAMATFTLTLVLAAGVFGRTIAGWIVAGIEQAEPMMHFVAEDELEAHYIIAKLLTFELNDEDPDLELGDTSPRKIQVEINGHIFVSRRRIVQHSRIPGLLFGIIAPPFDLLKAARKLETHRMSEAMTSQSDVNIPLTSMRPKGVRNRHD